MSVITYREAVARGIAQEMRADSSVVFLGEDVASAGGVFKATVGLAEEFGPARVRDTPISEQAILGAAMGAAMTGLRPIAEIMFSDFFAVCWDLIANEIAKSRYMSDGQVSFPLVIRCANGAGVRFGAQHSQSVENWAMAVPGLKVVAPSTPRDVVGLLAAAVRDPDPVIFFESKSLYATKGEVGDGEIVGRLGEAAVVREGADATILALAAMVPRSSPRSRKPAGCSRSRRTPGCAAGERRSSRSSPRSASARSPGRRSGSPPRTSRCRPRTASRITSCRRSRGSPRPSGSPWRLADSVD
jgi:pyruvate dehydrogenase E1 component beta subunit